MVKKEDIEVIYKTNNFAEKRFSKIQQFLNLKFLNEQVILAGGALRNLFNKDDVIEDFDLFFLGKEIKKIKDELEEKIKNLGGKKIFQCKEDELRSFELYGFKIQFISLKNIKYESPQKLLDSFDINACRFAFDGENLYFCREGIRDIIRNHITVHVITYPASSLKRIAKYNKKGFKVTLAAKEFVRQVAQNHENMDLETVYVD